MTVHPCTSSNGPSDEEAKLITQLRNNLRANMAEGIPDDLDTECNLLRWLRGYRGNIDAITKAFPVYVASRKAIGFDDPNIIDSYFEMPFIKPFLKYISYTMLNDRLWIPERNAFLFLEKGWEQPKEIVKVFRTSDYMIHCFGFSEVVLQLLLRREKAQGKNAKPVQFIVLFDLSQVCLTDYLNPLSAHLKMWQLRADIWQQWYPGMVRHIYVLNPPRFLSVLWRLARVILNEDNFKLIEVVTRKEDLLKHLPASVVPKEFGGDFVNTIPPADATGLFKRKRITADDHCRSYESYKKFGIERPSPIKEELPVGGMFTHTVEIHEKSTLIWDISASGDFDFVVYQVDEKTESIQRMVYPFLRLNSAKIPEEGVLESLNRGTYRFEIRNSSSYFHLKLNFCCAVVPAQC